MFIAPKTFAVICSSSRPLIQTDVIPKGAFSWTLHTPPPPPALAEATAAAVSTPAPSPSPPPSPPKIEHGLSFGASLAVGLHSTYSQHLHRGNIHSALDMLQCAEGLGLGSYSAELQLEIEGMQVCMALIEECTLIPGLKLPTSYVVNGQLFCVLCMS